MKIKNTKSLIVRPLLVGSVGLLFGIGLFIYYKFYAKEATIASYFISILIMIVGALGMMSTVYFLVFQFIKLNVKKNGIKIKAEYISNNTKVKSSGINYYYIEYKYNLDGVEVIKRSPSEFTWKEVLTIKAIKNFDIQVYKNRVVLDCDLEELFEKNKDAVRVEEKKYEEAYIAVDKIINK